MKQRLGTHPVVVSGNCQKAQEREGQWTVPKHRGLSPACAVFKEATGYAPPRAWREHIDASVPQAQDALKRWYDTCFGWVGCGWSPRNVKGMLDHYVVGKIPTTRGGNGSCGTPAVEVNANGFRTVTQTGSIGW